MYRLAHVITGLSSGGAEIMMCKLLAGLKQQGYVSTVISLMDEGVLAERIRSLGVPVYTVGLRRGIPSLPGYLRLVKILRQCQPQLIQGWMYHGNLAAYYAARRIPWQLPIIWNIRQTVYDLSKEKMLTRIVIKHGASISGGVDKIIYNSVISREQHQYLGYNQDISRIIYNGFDVDEFRPKDLGRHELRTEIGVPAGTLLVGMIARYHPMKNYYGLLQAAKILLDKTDKIHFVLVGRGVDGFNHELRKMLEELRLARYVSMLGERMDIARIMSGLDIMVMGSAWGEGFPNVVGEAMACGIPCVVTDVGESAYIVDGCGKVVPAGDSQALASGVYALIELEQERRDLLGDRARKRVVDNFSLEKISADYNELYREVLKSVA